MSLQYYVLVGVASRLSGSLDVRHLRIFTAPHVRNMEDASHSRTRQPPRPAPNLTNISLVRPSIPAASVDAVVAGNCSPEKYLVLAGGFSRG